VEAVAPYFEIKTNTDFNARMNVEQVSSRQRDVRRLLLFSTPRFGIPGEHRINQAAVNSDKLMLRLIKR
jgi:hypothetical protein